MEVRGRRQSQAAKTYTAKHNRSFWQEITKWDAILIQHASVAAVGRCLTTVRITCSVSSSIPSLARFIFPKSTASQNWALEHELIGISNIAAL